ncbi:MAG: phosphodiesterase [Pseudomonadota bacterium]
MKKLLVFTDIHIVPQGETIIGLDPLERFSQGLQHALNNHPDAERIVITGDLTHHGTHDEYMLLHETLSDCPLPLSMTLGNHDRRAAFLEVFQDVSVTDAGFVQESVDLDETRLILLDTLDEDADNLHGGLLCEDRLNWMDQAIASADGRNVILGLHHPPVLTGFPGMDSIGLANRSELALRLGRHDNVVQILAGHIHRTIQGSLAVHEARNIPVFMFKSPCHQMPMHLSTEDHHISVDEPGAYGIVLNTDDGILVHTEDFTL